MANLPAPHWERGHRVHGYWIATREVPGGAVRVGNVGLSPRGLSTLYHWECNGRYGDETKLAPAKRRVEKVWAALNEDQRQRAFLAASRSSFKNDWGSS